MKYKTSFLIHISRTLSPKIEEQSTKQGHIQLATQQNEMETGIFYPKLMIFILMLSINSLIAFTKWISYKVLILCCHYFDSKFHGLNVCINFYITSPNLFSIKLRDKRMYFPMQMNFYSFDDSYQKESVVFQSEWLVIFDPRLLSCWSWWQQIPSPKSTVKLWDDDVSSWSTSLSDKCGKRFCMKSSETARKSYFDD